MLNLGQLMSACLRPGAVHANYCWPLLFTSCILGKSIIRVPPRLDVSMLIKSINVHVEQQSVLTITLTVFLGSSTNHTPILANEYFRYAV